MFSGDKRPCLQQQECMQQQPQPPTQRYLYASGTEGLHPPHDPQHSWPSNATPHTPHTPQSARPPPPPPDGATAATVSAQQRLAQAALGLSFAWRGNAKR